MSTTRWGRVRAVGLVAALLLGGCRAAGPAAEAPAPAQPEVVEEPAPEAEAPRRPAAPAVLGVLVPRSGSAYLQRYGELVLQGVEVAVRRSPGGPGAPVELVVLDDGGDAAGAARGLRELEARGAVGVVGPLLTDALLEAARARSLEVPVVVSPTASEPLEGSPNVYTLNAPEPGAAAVLAEYALESGLRRAAVLHPRTTEFIRQADVFRATFEAGGGTVVEVESYDSVATTFGRYIDAIVDAAPDAVFLPGPERSIRQLAPQLVYYGLDPTRMVLLGGEAWTAEVVRRQLPEARIPELIAVTPMLEEGPGSGWPAFVEAYEALHRRSLDNPYPALGHDAAAMILSGIERGGADPAAVAEAVAATRELVGASGTFSVVEGEVRRRPFLVRIRRGELIPMQVRPAPDREGRGGSR